ncbi:Ig-like domain-containing protein [Variovorax sp. J2P1-59]|uniref:Ig-like domain-containing protein n=1 Tax=Variovorax flavidus TaxID=3053501 RepID=UPI0025759029|nr:Ig-like domain-containing protein [Variovorax sp. J2P1-59]MDM0076071.1 Ig-like domain-containing protein [Variovorax sp. J2P1-59]
MNEGLGETSVNGNMTPAEALRAAAAKRAGTKAAATATAAAATETEAPPLADAVQADNQVAASADATLTDAPAAEIASTPSDLAGPSAEAAGSSLADETHDGVGWVPMALLGGGVAAVGLAASSSGSGSSGSSLSTAEVAAPTPAGPEVHPPAPADVDLGSSDSGLEPTAPQETTGLSTPTSAVDAIAPAWRPELRITAVMDDVGPRVGNVAPGGAMDDTRPVLHGTGTPGHTVAVHLRDAIGTREMGKATVDANGNWSLAIAQLPDGLWLSPPAPGVPWPDSHMPLRPGANEFIAVEFDASGRKIASSEPYTVIVDTPVLQAPVITGVVDDVGPVQGKLEQGGVTNDAAPTIFGTAQPGSLVTIHDGGVVLGSVVTEADGKWHFTPESNLIDGKHAITATLTDPGGQSVTTEPWNFVVDTWGPAGVVGRPTITDDVGDWRGVLEDDPLLNGPVTDDSRPTFDGEAEPGSTVSIWIDAFDGSGRSIEGSGRWYGGALVDPAGHWTFTPSAPLADGHYSFTFWVADEAGNGQILAGAPVRFLTVETGEMHLALNALVDSAGDMRGNIFRDGVSDERRPEVLGTGKAGSIVTVYDGDTVLGSTTVDVQGNWTFVPGSDLADGLHRLTAIATDGNGRTTERTEAFSFTVDMSAVSNFAITYVEDDTGPVTGNVASWGVTDDTSPVIHGTGRPGHTVILYGWALTANGEGTSIDRSQELGRAMVDENGNWSTEPLRPLQRGVNDFTAFLYDEAGDAISSVFYAVEVVPHSSLLAPVIADVIDDVGSVVGGVAPGEKTDDTHPLIRGTGTAGDTIVVSVRNSSGSYDLGRATVDADGTWSLQVGAIPEGLHIHPPSDGVSWPLWMRALPAGANEFTAAAIDAAGNHSPTSAPYEVFVDMLVPVVLPRIEGVFDDVGSRTGNVAAGSYTDDARPEIHGTGTAGEILIVRVTMQGEPRAIPEGSGPSIGLDGSIPTWTVELGSVTVEADGRWKYQVNMELPDGSNKFTVVALDELGDRKVPSQPYEIEVYAAGPVAWTFPLVQPDAEVLFDGADMLIALPALAPSAPGAGPAVQAEPAPGSSVYSNLGGHTVPLFEEKGALVLL